LLQPIRIFRQSTSDQRNGVKGDESLPGNGIDRFRKAEVE
jgi:hypothetical protein